MKKLFFLLLSFSVLFNSISGLNFDFTFDRNDQGWVGGFADYPAGDEEFFELAFGHAPLPKPIPVFDRVLSHGLYLSGNNHSDDLFMFIKRPIDGLERNTAYALSFQIILENNIPSDQFGIGGSPGESVYVKVGGAAEEPQKLAVNGFYEMNIDKGHQSAEGVNSIVVGNLSNVHVDSHHPDYEPIVYLTSSPLNITSDAEGRIWVFVGTDSGFEGSTLYYIARVIVDAIPLRG